MKKNDDMVDVKNFYSNLFVTNEIYNIVQENNYKILKQRKKDSLMKTEELTADIEYIVSFVNNKALILSVIEEMKKYSFKDVHSLNKETFNSYGVDSTRYHILHHKINLYVHTFNVAMQMVDMLVESEHPATIIEICVLLALFHDFGKCPQIALNFTENSGEGHEKISANFAKHFLTSYLHSNPKTNINDEIIQVIYSCLYNHHNPIADKSVFLNMLIKADRNARDLELRMVKMKKASDAGI